MEKDGHFGLGIFLNKFQHGIWKIQEKNLSQFSTFGTYNYF